MTSPPGRPSERTGRLRASRGITLMELVIVMGLIALLLGLSVGAYGKLTQTHQLDAAVGGVRGLLLRARNTAREEGYPTVVVVDALARESRAEMRSWVGIWHFEIEDTLEVGSGGAMFDVRGLRSTYGQVFGADRDAALDEGKLGDGLRFGLGVYIDAGDEPAFNPTEGVTLEAWIKTDDLAPPPAVEGNEEGEEERKPEKGITEMEEFMVICKGRYTDPYDFSYFLRVTSEYAVEAGIQGPRDSNADAGRYIVSTYAGAFEPHRWTKVAMTYDGRWIEIRVNGVPRGVQVPRVGGERLRCPPRLEPKWGTPLLISHPDRSFAGIIDEVRIGSIHSPERARYRLPGEVSFLVPADPVGDVEPIHVRFDSTGRLDPFLHPRPVEILLTDAEGYRPGDIVKREILEAEAERAKKTRKPTPEEQRTVTPGEPPTVPEDKVRRIVIDLSGHIE